MIARAWVSNKLYFMSASAKLVVHRVLRLVYIYFVLCAYLTDAKMSLFLFSSGSMRVEKREKVVRESKSKQVVVGVKCYPCECFKTVILLTISTATNLVAVLVLLATCLDSADD